MRIDLLERLGMAHPIIQAPMAGSNATPPALVAAVSNAGGLGSLGAAYMSPDQIATECAAIRALTTRPFGVNLFVPAPAVAMPPDIATALARIAPFHAELGIPAPSALSLSAFSFDDQLEAALEGGAAVLSFTFGLLPGGAGDRIRSHGVYLVGTATTVDEATALERAGVDAIVAQGSEAGGHRGTFMGAFEAAMIGAMALVPQIVDAVRVPVIAAGGIMDGRGIRAALALGADAVQMGTAFLVTDECGVASSYKAAVRSAADGATRITRAFSGRPARGIPNRAMEEIERGGGQAILPYPYQNAMTRAMRTAAAGQNRSEFLSLWAGQSARLARPMPAALLVATLVREMSSSGGS